MENQIKKRYEYKLTEYCNCFYDNIFENNMTIKQVIDRLNFTHLDIIEKSKLLNKLKLKNRKLEKELKRYK